MMMSFMMSLVYLLMKNGGHEGILANILKVFEVFFLFHGRISLS